jgi:hypothetical protein
MELPQQQNQQPPADAAGAACRSIAGPGGRHMQPEWLPIPSRVLHPVPIAEAQEESDTPHASTPAQHSQQQQSGRHLVRIQSAATSGPQGTAPPNAQPTEAAGAQAGGAAAAAPPTTSRLVGSLPTAGGSAPLRSALARSSAGFQDESATGHSSRGGGGIEGALSRAGSLTSVKSVRFGGRASTAGGSGGTSDAEDLSADEEEGGALQGEGHTGREGEEGSLHRRSGQGASRGASPAGSTRSRRGSRRSTGQYGSSDGTTAGQYQRASHAGSDHRSSAHSTFLTSQGAVGRAGSGVGSAGGEQVDPEDVWDWLPSQLHLQLSAGVLSLQHPFDAMEHMDVSGENPMEGSMGAAWRDTMSRLARSATAQDMLDALRKRHELHVSTFTAAEQQPQVFGVARVLVCLCFGCPCASISACCHVI